MIFAGIIFLLSQNGSWEQDFFSADGCFSFSATGSRETIRRFFKDDLFASWANLGCKGSMDVPNGPRTAGRPRKVLRKRRDEVNAAIPIVCAKI